MNPLLLKTILAFSSPKQEFTSIISLFVAILLFPLLSVLIITNTGIPLLSHQLANTNATNHTIVIHDPTGKIVATLSSPTFWPIHGIVTLEFGASDLPFQPLHTGIDIAGKNGDPITPFMKGTVIYANEISWGFGKHVILDNGNNITSIYAHLSEIDTTVGQVVQPGDIIGKEGMTGWATGPHLHFQINVFGIPVDPRTFIAGNP